MRIILFCLFFVFSLNFSTLFAQDKIKVACIGDSITFGAGVENRGKNNYPKQLESLLGKAYSVSNFGVNGATLLKKGDKPYWKLKQFQRAKDLQPQIVIIKLGTNDTKPHNWKHKEDFAKDYTEMISTFKNLKSKPKIYVCNPVPVFPAKWGINDKTVKGEVIPSVKKVAKEQGVEIIDLYTPFVGKPKLVPDKVHPNAEGAKLIAKTVHAAISKQ